MVERGGCCGGPNFGRGCGLSPIPPLHLHALAFSATTRLERGKYEERVAQVVQLIERLLHRARPVPPEPLPRVAPHPQLQQLGEQRVLAHLASNHLHRRHAALQLGASSCRWLSGIASRRPHRRPQRARPNAQHERESHDASSCCQAGVQARPSAARRPPTSSPVHIACVAALLS